MLLDVASLSTEPSLLQVLAQQQCSTQSVIADLLSSHSISSCTAPVYFLQELLNFPRDSASEFIQSLLDCMLLLAPVSLLRSQQTSNPPPVDQLLFRLTRVTFLSRPSKTNINTQCHPLVFPVTSHLQKQQQGTRPAALAVAAYVDGSLQTVQYRSTKTPIRAGWHKLEPQFMSPSDQPFATLTSARQQAPEKSCIAEPSSELLLPDTSHNPGAVVVDQQQDLLQ